MRNEATLDSVHARYVNNARVRTGQTSDSDSLPDTLLSSRDAANFPYLERIMAATQKHPYLALGAMISVAGIVVSAVVVVAVSVFTGMFLMYGTMRETTANQIQIQTALVAIAKQQTDDMNAIRAYESNVSRRTEFLVGLMTENQQRRIADYDRANPRAELPTTRRPLAHPKESN